MGVKFASRFAISMGLLPAALALAGCAAPMEAQRMHQECPPDCTLEITLPEDPQAPPEMASHQRKLIVTQGRDVTFLLQHAAGQAGRAATVLSFPRAAFQNRPGKPLHTIVVTPGPRGREVTARAVGNCPENDPCKYTIINKGNEERPPLDPWIIIRR